MRFPPRATHARATHIGAAAALLSALRAGGTVAAGPQGAATTAVGGMTAAPYASFDLADHDC
ncbi:hypothetical protein ACSCB1_10010 [Streptomyces europaeiscabiei]|uniref:Uncharacterized protein n=1 Tax=Streptomyces europaeiscabiei TaxID=146819 RepID=A0ABU4N652_9ACTN|nr:hypothetical protein [Streptomyces europaeiscabiei]MDX2523591.1 hypothetical protein [Streptomyces europaeiscabiei]MDX2764983.1 hypothetical protein [Streptomyces europaeiscabiei]MDX2774430.1 hypothetical protein [Streptomyces europaeiscabiei]MDX3541938.1 hypothetical protein [Streptomyces europaeiscabiei]MDX3550932.1 hypothetical protein [Streptomyces europaeiscabiei]